MKDDGVMIVILIASLGSLYLAWRQYSETQLAIKSFAGSTLGSLFGVGSSNKTDAPGAPIGE